MLIVLKKFSENRIQNNRKIWFRAKSPSPRVFLSFRFPPSSTPSRRPRRYCSGTRCWVVRQHKPERGEGEKRGEKLKGREIVGRSDWGDLLPFIFRERNWGGKRMKRDGVGKNEFLSLFFFSFLFFIYMWGFISICHITPFIPKLPKLLPLHLPTS